MSCAVEGRFPVLARRPYLAMPWRPHQLAAMALERMQRLYLGVHYKDLSYFGLGYLTTKPPLCYFRTAIVTTRCLVMLVLVGNMGPFCETFALVGKMNRFYIRLILLYTTDFLPILRCIVVTLLITPRVGVIRPMSPCTSRTTGSRNRVPTLA